MLNSAMSLVEFAKNTVSSTSITKMLNHRSSLEKHTLLFRFEDHDFYLYVYDRRGVT